MRINPISVTPAKLPDLTPASKASSKEGVAGGPESFGATLKDAAREVNGLQIQADKLAQKMATGDIEDVHQAMIAMQKASLAMQFTVQVRNKIIDAYQEIMRTQI